MLSKTKVSRGHLTVVPKEVRKNLGVREGDILEWTLEGDRAIVRPRRRRSVEDIVGIISVGGNAVRDKKRVQRGEL